MKRASLVALLSMVPLVAAAQTTSPVVVGVQYTVNNNPGIQTDPHVSGNLVAYTEFNSPSVIRYQTLGGTDQVIPNGGATDAVSDVSGNLIVFTRNDGTRQAIYLFDTGAATATELAPEAGSLRNFASIGGDTVVWVDDGVTGSTAQSEIGVYDLGTGGPVTFITNDTTDDRDPAVSPDGNVITWAKCITAFDCDVHVAVRSGASWVTSALTAGSRLESRPATDGDLIAYEAVGTDVDRDIAFQPVGGGAEEVLDLAGNDFNPSAAGGLIAFEHSTIVGFDTNIDIYLYDTRTGILYNLTDTPTLNERLSDIDVDSSGVGTVVYVEDNAQGEDVYAFTFTVEEPGNQCGDGDPTSTGGGDDGDDDDGDDHGHGHGHHGHGHGHHGHGHHGHGHHGHGHGHGHHGNGHGHHGNGHGHGHGHHGDCDHDDDGGNGGGGIDDGPGCEDTTGRPVLGSVSVTRTHGWVSYQSTTFSATPGDALLCVTNGDPTGQRATSGWVNLNGNWEAGPHDFKKSVATIERDVSVGGQNTLWAVVAGKPGTSFTVTVYGPKPVDPCTETGAALARMTQSGFSGAGSKRPLKIHGEVMGMGRGQLQVSQGALAAGCSSSGAATGAFALLALCLLTLRRRPAAVTVRRR